MNDGVPGRAVIICIFVTLKLVVTIDATPADNAGTVIVSHASESLFKHVVLPAKLSPSSLDMILCKTN